MDYRMTELRCKEIVNIRDGMRLGFVCDASVEMSGGRVVSLIVPGRRRFFGLFGAEEDYILPWECIRRIGDDIILVDVEGSYRRERLRRP